MRPQSVMRALRHCAVAAFSWLLLGCSPALDWREVKVDGGGLTALFPCRPERRVRTVPLAGRSVRMEMVSCAADDRTYAVAFADIGDPAAVTASVAALRRAAVDNIGGSVSSASPFSLPGTTPNELSGRLLLVGRRPDGKTLQEHAVFFVRGLRVYQASVVGESTALEAVQNFFEALKLTV